MGKALTTPEAQAVTAGVVLDDTLTEVLEGAKCQFSNVTRGSSGKRNQTYAALLPLGTKDKTSPFQLLSLQNQIKK